MDNIELYSKQMDKAIEVMKEVSAWARDKGFRVWKDEWLTREENGTTRNIGRRHKRMKRYISTNSVSDVSLQAEI